MNTNCKETRELDALSREKGCVAFAVRHPKTMIATNVLLLAGVSYVLYQSHRDCSHFAEQMKICSAQQSCIAESIEKLEKEFSRKIAEIGEQPRTQATKQISVPQSEVGITSAQAFLEAARQEADATVQDVLYASAISRSQEKLPALQEYIGVQAKRLEKELASAIDDVTPMEERLANLAALCDHAINQGSVSDVKNAAKVRDALLAIKTQIDDRHNGIITRQQRLLEACESEVGSDVNALVLLFEQLKTGLEAKEKSVSRLVSEGDGNEILVSDTQEEPGTKSNEELWEECGQLVAYLQTANFDVTLHDRRDSLIVDIMNQASCLTPDDKPLEIPSITENTPWEKWLEHFVSRVKNKGDFSENALQEIEEAGAFLTEAEKAGKGKEQIESIAQMAKYHVALMLKKRADEFLSKPGESAQLALATASQLLAECAAIPTEQRHVVKSTEEKLFREIMEKSIKVCDDNVENVRNSYSDDMDYSVRISMYGAFQGQYTQLLQQLLTNADKGYESFDYFKNSLCLKIKGMKEVQEALVKLTMPPDQHAAQLRLYREYAEKKIDHACQLHAEAEKIVGILTPRSNEQCVWRYRDAWYELMRIHPGDLSQADAALSDIYTDLKRQIENHWPDYKNYLRAASGIAKRISDM